MERTAVRSRDLAIVGYDAENETLEITFRRGGVYHYAKVPAETHRDLMSASSLGIYFRDHIRDKYTATKVS